MSLLVLFCCFHASVADFQCFLDTAWSDDEVVVKQDIVYGSAFNNYTGKHEALKLDLYTPPPSDNRSLRPALVLIHGGSFVGGDKSNNGMPQLAKALVQRGFVAVSIDYRLTGKFWGAISPPGECCPGTNSDQYARDAAHDGKAAVRFLRAKAKELRVDVDRIGVAGDSAGAVTVLYMGYVQDVGEGSSGYPDQSSAVGVVMPISGELRYDAFCKGINQTTGIPYGCMYGSWNETSAVDSPKQAPLLLVHGTADTVVPIREAVALQARATSVGLQNILIRIPGAGHVPIVQLLSTDGFRNSMLEFLVHSLRLDTVPAECPSSAESSGVGDAFVV